MTTQAGATVENVQLQEKRLEQDRVRVQLQRYVSGQVLDSVLKDGALATERRELSILFADIRGFTGLCEELPAQLMVDYLNVYFSHMTDVVFNQGGTLDKFIGDMLMAFFNAPKALNHHERVEVQTAIEMQRRLKERPMIHRDR